MFWKPMIDQLSVDFARFVAVVLMQFAAEVAESAEHHTLLSSNGDVFLLLCKIGVVEVIVFVEK